MVVWFAMFFLFVKVTKESGFSPTGKRKEEGLFDWDRGEGEGAGEEEFRDGREVLHPSEWKPDAPTGTIRLVAKFCSVQVLPIFASAC
jgi:hypothetical protein